MNNFQFTVQLQQHTPILHFQHQQQGATLRATEVKPKLDKWVYDNFDKICELKPFDKTLKEHFNYKEKKASLYKMNFGKADNEEPILLRAGQFKDEERAGLKRAGIRFIENTGYFALQEYFKKEDSRDKSKKFIFEDDHDFKVKVYRYDPSLRKKTNQYIPESTLVPTYEEKLPIRGIILKEKKYLHLSLFSHDKGIIDILKFVLPLFFVCNNFGSRQTKAFGSFTVEETDDTMIRNTLKYFYDFAYMDNKTPLSKNLSRLEILQTLFQDITQDYRHIKSGKPNFPKGSYKKSQVYSYGQKLSPGYSWDKKFFKDNISNNKINGANLKRDKNNKKSLSYKKPDNYLFVRAILGLAENYEFATDGSSRKYVVEIAHDKKEIERFSSPIIWKIINDKIYLVGHQINSDILNQKFKVSYKLGNQSENIKDKITTPESFSLENFLDHSFEIGEENKRSNNDKNNQNGPVPGYEKL